MMSMFDKLVKSNINSTVLRLNSKNIESITDEKTICDIIHIEENVSEGQLLKVAGDLFRIISNDGNILIDRALINKKVETMLNYICNYGLTCRIDLTAEYLLINMGLK